jgi:hypothetical protein
MTRPTGADPWARALLPFPSVYDRAGRDAVITESPGHASTVRRRADGSTDCEHYEREARRLHREAVARAMHFVVSATRHVGSRLRRDTRKRADRAVILEPAGAQADARSIIS